MKNILHTNSSLSAAPANNNAPLIAMRKQLSRLRVQLITFESENKRLRKANADLQNQVHDSKRLQRISEDNFRVSTQRKFDLQSTKH